MNASIIRVVSFFALISCLSFFEIAMAQETKRPVIVLDPGHGGKDPGAIGKKNQEKAIVLNVALKVGKMLSDSLKDVKVVYTRNKDFFVPLDKRAEIANKNAADIFVSIHANATKNKDIYGAETFVMGLHKSKENLEVAQLENAAIKYEDDVDKYADLESNIMSNLMQSTNLEWSARAASYVQNALVGSGRSDRGLKQAGFFVLWKTAVPSILIEMGFITNPEEEIHMASEKGSTELATSIYSAIVKYISERSAHGMVSYVDVSEPEPAKPAVNLWPTGINYRVQVAVSKNKLKIDETKGVVSTISEEQNTKYMIGILTDFDKAQKLKESLKDSYPDCFIVAFDGKEKISVRAARKQQKD